MVNLPQPWGAYSRQYPACRPSVRVRAPGRVNLLGEHVDYNDGLVLPIAVAPSIEIVAGPSPDRRFHAYSAALDKEITFTADDLKESARPGWAAYVQGVAAELARDGAAARPTCLHIDGDLPMGAGLASSAALEVGVAMALLHVAGLTVPPQQVAAICRRAEHRHAGVPCGIMDQLVCTMAVEGTALLIDCRNQEIAYLPWADSEMGVVIIDSGVSRDLVGGAYAERVGECRAALQRIRAIAPSAQSWREVSGRHLADDRLKLEAPQLRRACHVISEIRRVQQAASALRVGDWAAFGRLMNEGHASLRDDFDVSTPRIDRLVRILQETPGVLGARMTGAGFGGCVVALTHLDSLSAVETAVRHGYDEAGGPAARLWWATPQGAACATELTEHGDA